MINKNGPDDIKSGRGGRDQRPHATLDLTAQDVSPKSEPNPNRSDKSASASGSVEKESAGNGGNGQNDGSKNKPGSPVPSVTELASHAGAGVVGGVLALLMGYLLFGGGEPAAVEPEQVDRLQTRLGEANEKLAALENRLNVIQDQSAETQTAVKQTAQNRQDMEALEQRLAAIETRPVTAAGATEEDVQQSLDPLATRLAALEQRIGSVEKAQGEVRSDDSPAVLALALYNLRQAIADGKPYAEELKAVSEMSPVALDLQELEKRRKEGVASLRQLQSSFGNAVNKALEAENQPDDDSVAANVWSKMRSLVRIRRKGNIPGESTRAILARTEYQLDAGDLQAALNEAQALDGAAAEAMQPWLSELKARIEAQKSLARIEARLLTKLGQDEAAKRGG